MKLRWTGRIPATLLQAAIICFALMHSPAEVDGFTAPATRSTRWHRWIYRTSTNALRTSARWGCSAECVKTYRTRDLRFSSSDHTMSCRIGAAWPWNRCVSMARRHRHYNAVRPSLSIKGTKSASRGFPSSQFTWSGVLACEGLGGGGEGNNALLLRMEFEGVSVDQLRHWVRRYPFGTTLPVQPFSLVETEKGLNVIFRKKPTLERGSADGGLSFAVEGSVNRGQDCEKTRPVLMLRRISEGQEIRKVFAERIVVKAVVKALAGEGSPSAPSGTQVRAILHEGLV